VASVTPTALPVVDQMDLDNRAVRKHGTQILAIADLSVAAPDTFFENVLDGGGVVIGEIPKVLPAGFRSLGLITTDGIQESTSVSTSSVQSAQSTSNTRTDTDSETTTVQVSLQEMNGWVKAFANDLPVSEWPVDKDAAWRFKTGKRPEKPNYRLYILTQDGIGRDAVYRVEFAFNARVSDKGDRSLNRADEERVQRTLELFPDPKTGFIKDEAQTALRTAA
jgi:hypothetical protein